MSLEFSRHSARTHERFLEPRPPSLRDVRGFFRELRWEAAEDLYRLGQLRSRCGTAPPSLNPHHLPSSSTAPHSAPLRTSRSQNSAAL